MSLKRCVSVSVVELASGGSATNEATLSIFCAVRPISLLLGSQKLLLLLDIVAVQDIHFIVYNLYGTVYSVQCILDSVLCTMYSA